MTNDEIIPDQRIDVSLEVCPMTFVLVRLALDQMQPSQVLEILLQGDEPRRNIPQTATEQGHEVLSLSDQEDGKSIIFLRKAP